MEIEAAPTPWQPAAAASRARRSTSAAAGPIAPMSSRSPSAIDVSTVTASTRAGVPAVAATAAASIARPPPAWTVTSSAPCRAACAIARPTVSGMSCSLRSSITRCPAARIAATTSGPAAMNSSRPTFTHAAAGPTRAASAWAPAVSGTSSATISRLPGSKLMAAV